MVGEWRLPGLLYANYLVLCGETEEDLRGMVGRFAEVCKSKVMVLNGEEVLECEVHVDGIRIEHVLEFKYLECVLDESATDGEECIRKVASGVKFAIAIRSLVNATDL